MQFRQKALSKLQSPEELDLPVRLAHPQGRFVLAVTVLVIAALTFWAFTGSVSSTVSAPGILTHGEGSYVLQSPVAGQVTGVLVSQGQLVSPGTPMLTVETAKGERTVRAVAEGQVTALAAKTGSMITTGANVAVLERLRGPNDPLVAVVYLPPGSDSAIPVGAPVNLAVQSVPQQFGVLRGHVTSVGGVPETQQQISDFLGDSQLAAQFAQQGDPTQVLIQLDRSSATKSGYQWSTTNGPPYAIDSRTPLTGTIQLAAQHPIDWLLP